MITAHHASHAFEIIISSCHRSIIIMKRLNVTDKKIVNRDDGYSRANDCTIFFYVGILIRSASEWDNITRIQAAAIQPRRLYVLRLLLRLWLIFLTLKLPLLPDNKFDENLTASVSFFRYTTQTLIHHKQRPMVECIYREKCCKRIFHLRAGCAKVLSSFS